MPWDYKTLMNGVVDYLTTKLSNPTTDYNYIGLLPKIGSSGDFKNIPPGLFPLVGVMFDQTNFVLNGAMAANSPTLNVQILFAVRQSGATPQEDHEFFLTKLEEMQNILIEAERSTLFDMPTDILGLTVMGVATYPTFYTEVDQNRKAYDIGIYPLELYVSAI